MELWDESVPTVLYQGEICTIRKWIHPGELVREKGTGKERQRQVGVLALLDVHILPLYTMQYCKTIPPDARSTRQGMGGGTG